MITKEEAISRVTECLQGKNEPASLEEVAEATGLPARVVQSVFKSVPGWYMNYERVLIPKDHKYHRQFSSSTSEQNQQAEGDKPEPNRRVSRWVGNIEYISGGWSPWGYISQIGPGDKL